MSGNDSPRKFKIVIINKSDSTGGAAVVSRRLMETFRAERIDARMLVTEKLTASPYVEVAAPRWKIQWKFLAERLRIFLANGFNRSTLFKIDTASDGLPLWKHPLVKDADAILINWVNQGMLSLRGIGKIAALGKPVVWTMHDMWCMTGICHHAGQCQRFRNECGECPLLGAKSSPRDLSALIWRKKYATPGLRDGITYVAVSTWLADKARQSGLLRGSRLSVIPNAFPVRDAAPRKGRAEGKIRILFGAARVDDPIKGLPVLVEATKVLAGEYPELASRMELVTFGGVKDPESLAGMGITHRHLGMIRGEDAVREVYESADILVSASSYETLPGTLVEAQAYGCIPVSFNQGGQRDIVEHLQTGYIAEYSADSPTAARRLAEGIIWAAGILGDAECHGEMLRAMRENVETRFSPHAVAAAYLKIIRPTI